MKRALLVSLNFPPSTIASAHRVRHLAKHLPAHGWQPLVLTVDESFHKEPPDPGLGALVPGDVKVIRTAALPYAVTRWLGIGDLALRAMLPLIREIDRACVSFGPDIVFITGWPFYQMLLTRRLRVRHHIPVVLDFQDPWVSAEGGKRPRFSKGAAAHRLAVALEPRAVRPASWITSVSDTQNAEMASRYPWLDPHRMTAIPIGGDPDDFDALRLAPPENCAVRLDPKHINLCYVGTFLPRAGEVVRSLFKGAARLMAQQPDLSVRLRLVFVGTSNQPPGTAVENSVHRVRRIAVEEGVPHLVQEHAPRVPFLEALSLLANADAILMLGSDEPHYTASKIYPGLMSGRPWLSMFHSASSAHSILSAAGGGVALSFVSDPGSPLLARQAADALALLCTQPGILGKASSAAYDAFTAHSVARQFATVFEQAMR